MQYCSYPCVSRWTEDCRELLRLPDSVWDKRVRPDRLLLGRHGPRCEHERAGRKSLELLKGLSRARETTYRVMYTNKVAITRNFHEILTQLTRMSRFLWSSRTTIETDHKEWNCTPTIRRPTAPGCVTCWSPPRSICRMTSSVRWSSTRRCTWRKWWTDSRRCGRQLRTPSTGSTDTGSESTPSTRLRPPCTICPGKTTRSGLPTPSLPSPWVTLVEGVSGRRCLPEWTSHYRGYHSWGWDRTGSVRFKLWSGIDAAGASLRRIRGIWCPLYTRGSYQAWALLWNKRSVTARRHWITRSTDIWSTRGLQIYQVSINLMSCAAFQPNDLGGVLESLACWGYFFFKLQNSHSFQDTKLKLCRYRLRTR